MIQGTGFDLTALSRIASLLERYGDRFLTRVLTERERESLPSASAGRTAYVAGRFAAKEAAVKALGTGFSEGVGMHDVEILPLASGRPELHLHGAAAARAESRRRPRPCSYSPGFRPTTSSPPRKSRFCG